MTTISKVVAAGCNFMPKTPRKRTVVFFDPDTGEVVPVSVEQSRRAHFTFMGGFVVIGLETFKMLRRLNLPKDAHHVFYFLLEHVARGNMVMEMTNARIAEECGIYPPRASAMVKALEAGGMIKRGLARGNFYLNPNLYFRGPAAEQAAAAEVWNREQLRIVARNERRA